MALVVRQTMAGQAWVAQPNRSLSPAQGARLILAAAGVSGGIAAAFAAFGAWPVIPFAGLEIGALWAALHYLRRHADDEERLEIGERLLTLTRRCAGRDERHELIRYWVRLRIETAPATCRLYLRAHGRELEIGRMLTERQKEELAAELKARLGTAKP